MKRWIMYCVGFLFLMLISLQLYAIDQNSYMYFLQSNALHQDDMISALMPEEILSLRTIWQTKENISLIDKHNTNAKISEKELLIQNAQYKNILIYSSVGIMIILIVVILVYRRNALKLKKLNNELEAKQKELMDQHHKLNELYHDQQKLITILAHDLNAPFDRIKGLAFILSHSEDLNEEQNKIIEKIERTAENSKALVDDIIYSFRNEEEQPELEKEEIDTVKFFEDIVETHRYSAARKNIHIDARIDQITVQSNALYLSRITDNLLTNAIKFSPKGGEIFFEVFKNNDLFCFSVRDNGPGISAEEQKLLFKRFQKLSNRPTGDEQSTGLGLSITKSLVDKLNGKIEVESEKGQGSKFIVCFPIQ